MVKKITKIVLLLLLTAVVFSIACSKKDEIAFKRAEESYNAGKVVEAKDLYTQFIRDFPTSKWRQVAEKQLEKSVQILELKEEANKFEHNKQFNQTKTNYIKILSINPSFDTVEIFQVINKKLEESLVEDSVFLEDLVMFLYYSREVRIYNGGDIWRVKTFGFGYLYDALEEVSSNREKKQKIMVNRNKLYNKIITPSPNYQHLASDIKKLRNTSDEYGI